MNEQQRLFLTLTTCMGIWLGWMYFTGGLEPQVPAAPVAVTAPAPGTPVDRGASASPAAAASRDFRAQQPALRAAPVAAITRRAFTTQLLDGEVQDGDGALASLTLPAFAPRVLDEDARETARGVALLPQAPNSTGLIIDQAGLNFTLASGALPLHFVDGEGLHLAGEADDGTRVSVRLQPDPQRYAIDYEVEIVNGGARSQAVAAGLTLALAPLDVLEPDEPTEAASPSFWGRMFGGLFGGSGGGKGTERLRGLLAEGPKLTRKDFSAAKSKGYASAQPVDWAAVDEQYFLLAWVPSDEQRARASLFTRNQSLGLNVAYEGTTLAPNAAWRTKFRLFAGPKRDQELQAVDARLVESIDYTFLGVPLGFLARPMVFLLRHFHGATHSWGLSILLLTLVVKTVLLPVVYKSVTSMRRMQEIKPELDRIKERYAGDSERLNAEQIKLFKDRGVNPVSGCLPMLLQMPVWLTLYRTLWGAVDLYRQPFLWLTDLTAREPFPYLALVVGAVTYLQQKVTPVAMDNQQARIMAVMMPGLVTVFMINMPCGLVLYILANSVLTILQQVAIHRYAGTSTKA